MGYVKLLKAVEFAEKKHRGQTRKDAAATPFITHPLKVARVIADVGGVTDTDVLAAAVLHDTIEDTDTTYAELKGVFGAGVADLVLEVTDDKTLSSGEQKKRQAAAAGNLSKGAALIRIGDKICNVHDTAYNTPPDWDEKRRLEYITWAAEVIANCPKVNDALKKHFQARAFKAYVRTADGVNQHVLDAPWPTNSKETNTLTPD